MSTILPMTTHTACNGSGEVSQGGEFVRLLPDRSSWDPAALRKNVKLDPTKDHEIQRCHSCKGVAHDGVTYARYRDSWSTYGEPYKSESTLKAAITRGKATVCKMCGGLGDVAWLPVMAQCYGCRGRGTVPQWTGDTDALLPPEVDLTENSTKEFFAAWLASCDIVVVPVNRGNTWNESFLGLGNLITITDYGRMVQLGTVEAIKAAALEYMAKDRDAQFSHLVDKDTRLLANKIAVVVTRTGWHAKTARVDGDQVRMVKPHEGAMLPPTYTSEILNRTEW